MELLEKEKTFEELKAYISKKLPGGKTKLTERISN